MYDQDSDSYWPDDPRPMDDYGRPLDESYQQALRQQAENEQRGRDQAAADAIESECVDLP